MGRHHATSKAKEPSLADAMGEAPCAVVCLWTHDEWHAHDVLLWNGTSLALDWSEMYRVSLFSSAGGGSILKRGNKIQVPRFVDPKPWPRVWIAPSLVLCDGRWRPCSAEKRKVELVTEPLCFDEIAERQEVGWSALYCAECDDYMPFDGGQHCEHVWWCEFDRAIRGATNDAEPDPCNHEDCWECTLEREERQRKQRIMSPTIGVLPRAGEKEREA